ncbi:NADH dehydrogenase [hydrothermal vent metagenome]|uniref:NADH dehydrogenase n=1 Tax=hydrothermal vent metagenome TaxID=652676 RepID=A0A3B0ZMR1_9ZZZZ
MSGKKLAIIATKGSLDWAYPPFILASTAAALGYEVEIFCTFYGLQLLRKKMDLKVTSLGNPGMPMPIPMPVLLQALPGMQSMMTLMMKQKMKSKGVASLEELRELCIEAEVRLVACQMTVDLFDFNTSDFIDGVEYGGAATFFEFAGESDITLFV